MKRTFLCCVAIASLRAVQAQWTLTGNAGTNPPVNFIGTTDLKDVVFKSNGLERMRITSDGRVHFLNQGSFNLLLGYQAGKSNTTGIGNSALGYQALYVNTTGSRNTALGSEALFTSKTGNDNTAAGYFSMYVNTSGSYNTAYGSVSLNLNSTGSSNVAVGYSALYHNQSASYNTGVGLYAGTTNTRGAENTYIGNSAGRNGDTGSVNTFVGSNAGYNNKMSKNTFIGAYAGFTNSIGYSNLFTGYTAGYSNSTGWQNTFTGHETGYKNSTGYRNIAMGFRALYANTTGHDNISIGVYSMLENTTGTGNTALGNTSLFYNTTGYSNTAIGQSALSSITSAGENTAVGNSAGFSNVTSAYDVFVGSYAGQLTIGGQNTYVGTSAGRDLVNGFYNTCVGINAGYSNFSNTTGSATLVGAFTTTSNSLTNVMALGYQASVTASNRVRIGNSSVTSIGGYAGWTNLSDGRYKKEVKQNVPGLVFINQLNPVTYQLDMNKLSAFLGEGESDGKKDGSQGMNEAQRVSDEKNRRQKESLVYTGFVAQEVEAVAKKLNYDFSGVDKPDNDKNLYGLRYAEFVVPLVKAVQELSSSSDKKDTVISALQNDIKNLQAEMKELRLIALAANHLFGSGVVTDASLGQNTPNPFDRTTTIRYRLPQRYATAQILITDKAGRTLKTIAVTGTGNGSATVTTNDLSSGSYQYSLLVDGQLISTKQMEHLR